LFESALPLKAELYHKIDIEKTESLQRENPIPLSARVMKQANDWMS
jgi:hypothetical protein